jgi:phage shock protein PspC (stress-responsive transcriptional regulator)
MRTVITISLNGNAYQLDAVGYEALRAYLHVAEQRLAGNPDQTEILADLEQAIADKCRRYLGPHKNVVGSDEVAEVLREMGPVDGGTGESAQDAAGSMGGGAMGAEGLYAGAAASTGAGQNGAPGNTSAGDVAGAHREAAGGSTGGGVGAGPSAADGGTGGASGDAPRRLYQIREGAVFSGVCKGLAAYLNIDVAIIRALFIALVVLTGGVWILVYVVMMFVIPYAQTSEQHAAAHGWPFNAEELVARAKAHYAQFRENGSKWQRKAFREQRRMWRSQHKQWKEHQRAWERWGGPSGNPPPPPPPSPGWAAGQQPPNPSYSYSSQLLNGVLSPIVGVLGIILFFTFLWMVIAMIKHHTLFGWWMPHEIPLWVGIVFLIVLYRAVASPLNHAKYAAHYGTPVGHAWVALFGALIWLAFVVFLAWLAWQHWDEVLDFLQQIGNFFRDAIDHREPPPSNPENAAFYFLAWGVPSCVLPGYIASRELDSHGEVDGPDVLGESADGDVVDSCFSDRAYGFERHAA